MHNIQRVLFILLATIAISLQLSAQISSAKLLTPTAEQYNKMEWDIQLTEVWSNPYNFSEIALDLKLTSPSGKTLSLPCFYLTGQSGQPSNWRARFAPTEQGVYQYRFELSRNGQMVSATELSPVRVHPSLSGKGFLHTRDRFTLCYDNGEPFRGLGMNICWESRDSDDSKYFKALHEESRYNYDFMLKKLAANGGNFFRTWMIYWNLPVDWKTPKNNRRYQNSSSPFNESGMKRMDQLVELCDSLGIHMMVALESHVALMGEGWELSSYNAKNGGPAATPARFFALPQARQQYKNKLRLMVARYGYSPAIGAWEFFNEVDNAMYNVPADQQIDPKIVTAWHDEMSSFLKSIDPYHHIVTTSISHRDIDGMNDLKNIDLNQKHIYRNTAAIPETVSEYSARHSKPYTIGEFGYEWDWSKNFNDFAEEMDHDFRTGLWLGLFSPTPILPMSWWWEFFESRGMMEYFTVVRNLSDQMLKAGNGAFAPFAIQHPANEVTALALQCGNQHFCYLLNNSDTRQPLSFVTDRLPDSPNGMIKKYDLANGETTQLRYRLDAGQKVTAEQLSLEPGQALVLIW